MLPLSSVDNSSNGYNQSGLLLMQTHSPSTTAPQQPLHLVLQQLRLHHSVTSYPQETSRPFWAHRPKPPQVYQLLIRGIRSGEHQHGFQHPCRSPAWELVTVTTLELNSLNSSSAQLSPSELASIISETLPHPPSLPRLLP